MSNEKIPVDGGDSFAGCTESMSACTQFTTDLPPRQVSPKINVFEQAADQRGTLTARQLRTLDSLRNGMDSDRFNEFRNQCGIPDFTPNYKLSKRSAAALIRVILAARAAGDG